MAIYNIEEEEEEEEEEELTMLLPDQPQPQFRAIRQY